MSLSHLLLLLLLLLFLPSVFTSSLKVVGNSKKNMPRQAFQSLIKAFKSLSGSSEPPHVFPAQRTQLSVGAAAAGAPLLAW